MIRSAAVLATAAALSLAPAVTAGPAAAKPSGACTVDATSSSRTIDALMNRCTSTQIVDLFRSADVGQRPPAGKYRLHLLPVQQSPTGLAPYGEAKDFVTMQSRLGDALSFASGPQGQPWVYKHYIVGRDAGAPVEYAPDSFVDGRPAWTADFVRDFGGLPVSIHEYRQLTPTVWIGRDFLGGGTTANPPRRGGALAITAY